MNSQPIEEKPKLGQNFQNVCRLCMSEEMVEDVFKFEHEDLARRIFDLLCIVISKDDHISRSICVICRARLNEFSDYKVSCIEVQDLLQKRAGLVKAEVELLVENPEAEPVEHPAKKRCVMQSANSLSGPEQCASDVEVAKNSRTVPCEYCNKNISRIRLKRHIREKHSSELAASTSRGYRKRNGQKQYTEQQLQELIPKIKNGSLSMYQVTKHYGIPRSTLQFRLSGRFKQHAKPGRVPVLLPEEEQEICKWLTEMERSGFPVTKKRLQLEIANFLESSPRPNPFKGNVPGRRWTDAFLRRHPEFSMQTKLPLLIPPSP